MDLGILLLIFFILCSCVHYWRVVHGDIQSFLELLSDNFNFNIWLTVWVDHPLVVRNLHGFPLALNVNFFFFQPRNLSSRNLNLGILCGKILIDREGIDFFLNNFLIQLVDQFLLILSDNSFFQLKDTSAFIFLNTNNTNEIIAIDKLTGLPFWERISFTSTSL